MLEVDVLHIRNANVSHRQLLMKQVNCQMTMNQWTLMEV